MTREAIQQLIEAIAKLSIIVQDMSMDATRRIQLGKEVSEHATKAQDALNDWR